MAKYKVDGKDVEVDHDWHVNVVFRKPNSKNKIRVSFYYANFESTYANDTFFTVSVDEIKPRKLSSAQKLINKIRPHTYSETRIENLETDECRVQHIVFGVRGGDSYGNLDFGKQLNNIDSWYSGSYRDIVLEAKDLAIKGRTLDEQSQLYVRKNLSKYTGK